MLSQIAEILQDTLNLTRFASAPFVLNCRPDSIRQWLHGLHDRLTALEEKTTVALAAMDQDRPVDEAGWTDEECILSREWVNRNYPNESDPIQAALRKAWRDGQRLRAQRPADGHQMMDQQF